MELGARNNLYACQTQEKFANYFHVQPTNRRTDQKLASAMTTASFFFTFVRSADGPTDRWKLRDNTSRSFASVKAGDCHHVKRVHMLQFRSDRTESQFVLVESVSD